LTRRGLGLGLLCLCLVLLFSVRVLVNEATGQVILAASPSLFSLPFVTKCGRSSEAYMRLRRYGFAFSKVVTANSYTEEFEVPLEMVGGIDCEASSALCLTVLRRESGDFLRYFGARKHRPVAPVERSWNADESLILQAITARNRIAMAYMTEPEGSPKRLQEEASALKELQSIFRTLQLPASEVKAFLGDPRLCSLLASETPGLPGASWTGVDAPSSLPSKT